MGKTLRRFHDVPSTEKCPRCGGTAVQCEPILLQSDKTHLKCLSCLHEWQPKAEK